MGNIITAAKEHLGLDNEGLAAKLGVHRTSVMRMEKRGKVKGPVKILLDRLVSAKPKKRGRA